MATVTGLTKERMLEIEAASVVTGSVDATGELNLETHGGTAIDAGRVRGPSGRTVGEVFFWAGLVGAVPVGCIIADGSAISRTTYADLFAVYGITHGAGDGSATFNIPNYKGRVPIGYDSTQTEFNSLGKIGGEKTHTLSSTEMPSHGHTQDAHSHSYQPIFKIFNGVTSVSGEYVATGNVTAGLPVATYNFSPVTATAAATATNQVTGGGGAHNNLQPYLVGLWLVKALYSSSEINPVTTAHAHAITDVTGLQIALDAKAALVHTHAIADVTGLQTILDLLSHIGDTVSTQATNAQTGTSGAPMIYTFATLTIPTAGRWRITGGINAQSSVLDSQSVGLYDFTGSAEIANSRGGITVTGASPDAHGIFIRPITIDVALNRQYRVMLVPNGASVPSAIGAGIAGAPAVWLEAVRVR